MKLKIIAIATLLTGAALNSFAQYETDAFKFSGAENSTTARFGAMGGQQTSLGGDLSSLYGNPAGLGMFTKSEFTLTTGFNNIKSNSTFLGNSASSSLLNPNINNVGVVFHSPVSKFRNTKKGLLSLNFGIGYQKTNFFRNDLQFSGETNLNGLGDYFNEEANFDQNVPEDLSQNIVYGAWQGFLINAPSDSENYNVNTTSDSDQSISVDRMGGQSNFDLSLGLNISNKVYIGGGIGLASINYRSQERLNEVGGFIPNTDPNQDPYTNQDYSADFLQSYDTRGSGVNFKIGAIIKPVNELRIGLSLESPTYYNIDDTFYEQLSLNDPYNKSVNQDQDYTSNYKLRTPLKINGGISYFLGNKGFLTADLNYLDYSTIDFSSSIAVNNPDRMVNQSLRNNYKDVVNIGLGGELKVSNEFALRAGYRLMGDPYNFNDDVDRSVNRYTGGLGYRFGNYSLDGAIMVYDMNDGYSAYSLNNGNEPFADITNNVTRFSITFGARF